MKLFQKKQSQVHSAAVQVRSNPGHPFGALGRYVPLQEADSRLYRAIREAVPIVDAAILKLIRLGRLKLSDLVEETHAPTEAPEVYTRLCTEKTFPIVQFDWSELQ